MSNKLHNGLLGPVIVALTAIVSIGGCDAGSGEDSVGPVMEVTGTLIASLSAINGTYGAGCTARTGSWSVRISGADELVYPALTVVKGNAACSLAVTEFIGDETYKAVPPITMTTAYQSTASELTFGVEFDDYYYANAKLSSTSFTSDFVLTLLVSNDTTDIGAGVTAVPTSLPAATCIGSETAHRVRAATISQRGTRRCRR